jgi:hypothetical protein
MTRRLQNKMATLTAMTMADLRAEWQSLHTAPPPLLPEGLLRLAVGYRLQEKALGGLPAAAAKAVRRGSDGGATSAGPPPLDIQPGTRLIRSWHGRTIEVLVTEDGFLFEDECHMSLSSIARKVTGTAWSGPRFFGLNNHG